VIVIGKSVEISPFTVVARTSALRSGGRSSVMLPLTVWKASPWLQPDAPRIPRIDPFTVEASPYDAVAKVVEPFTVASATGPFSP
jgi:hypothetical protein